MYYFATLFDKNYLSRGLALRDSLKKHLVDFTLYVVALDEFTHDYITKLKDENFKAISINNVEQKFPDLQEAKKNRNLAEYYFTLSPFIPTYFLENIKGIDFITTLDADIYFFSSPLHILKNFEKYSILISAHNFPPNLKQLKVYGKYNVSFQSFRKDNEGLSVLKTWRKQCLDWCYDRLENKRYADQKYLDTWPHKYKSIHALKNKGAAIAPWNISNFKIKYRKGVVYCDDNKLVFYHFHHLAFIDDKRVIHGLDTYIAKSNSYIKNYIYKPYIFKLIKYNNQLNLPIVSRKRIANNITKQDLVLNRFGKTYRIILNSYLGGDTIEKLISTYFKVRLIFNGIYHRFKNIHRLKRKPHGY